MLSRNRPELAICDLAALHPGAAIVVLCPASPARTVRHVVADSCLAL